MVTRQTELKHPVQGLQIKHRCTEYFLQFESKAHLGIHVPWSFKRNLQYSYLITLMNRTKGSKKFWLLLIQEICQFVTEGELSTSLCIVRVCFCQLHYVGAVEINKQLVAWYARVKMFSYYLQSNPHKSTFF